METCDYLNILYIQQFLMHGKYTNRNPYPRNASPMAKRPWMVLKSTKHNLIMIAWRILDTQNQQVNWSIGGEQTALMRQST